MRRSGIRGPYNKVKSSCVRCRFPFSFFEFQNSKRLFSKALINPAPPSLSTVLRVILASRQRKHFSLFLCFLALKRTDLLSWVVQGTGWNHWLGKKMPRSKTKWVLALWLWFYALLVFLMCFSSVGFRRRRVVVVGRENGSCGGALRGIRVWEQKGWRLPRRLIPRWWPVMDSQLLWLPSFGLRPRNSWRFAKNGLRLASRLLSVAFW